MQQGARRVTKMGLLTLGHPLDWQTALDKGWLRYVREHGIKQFLHTYFRVVDRRNDVLKYGDEVRTPG